jgi:hypothetical protein
MDNYEPLTYEELIKLARKALADGDFEKYEELMIRFERLQKIMGK